MPSFIPFDEVKEKVSFADAMTFLDLAMKKGAPNQFRSECPTCGGNDRSLVITLDRGFYCWSAKSGGDVIGLAAHILKVSNKDAAQFLAEKAGLISRTGSSATVPESEKGSGGKLQALAYLEHAHDAVIALGLDPDFCERHGIGYAPKGVVRGSVAIPFRDEHGVLLGYFGTTDLSYIPPDFQTNVIPLRKKA